MLGAIIGDIIGSRFEFHNYKKKDFTFFHSNCFFTDDSLMTIAIAKAFLTSKEDYRDLEDKTVYWMQKIGRSYPYGGYGGYFAQWLMQSHPKPYHSYGNGAAMRISSVAYVAKSLKEVKELSYKVTAVTHNHPEGIKGAEAVAVAIYMAKNGSSMSDIKDYIHTHYYPMEFTLDSIRATYKFNETCQDTVPQALMAFFESNSYEDTIRNAISIGGDSDTVAAIAGSVAEAYYGIPQEMKDQGLLYLDDFLRQIIFEFIDTYILVKKEELHNEN